MERPAPEPFQLYGVVDWTTAGKLRVLAEFREPADAHQHAKLLRWASAVVRVVLMATIECETAS